MAAESDAGGRVTVNIVKRKAYIDVPAHGRKITHDYPRGPGSVMRMHSPHRAALARRVLKQPVGNHGRFLELRADIGDPPKPPSGIKPALVIPEFSRERRGPLISRGGLYGSRSAGVQECDTERP